MIVNITNTTVNVAIQCNVMANKPNERTSLVRILATVLLALMRYVVIAYAFYTVTASHNSYAQHPIPSYSSVYEPGSVTQLPCQTQ